MSDLEQYGHKVTFEIGLPNCFDRERKCDDKWNGHRYELDPDSTVHAKCSACGKRVHCSEMVISTWINLKNRAHKDDPRP